MGLFSRSGKNRRKGSGSAADLAYLLEWAAGRNGVEAFVEPQTRVTPLTAVLVDADGEWTRRPIDGAPAARRLGERLGIPVYDVQKVGYPKRMRRR